MLAPRFPLRPSRFGFWLVVLGLGSCTFPDYQLGLGARPPEPSGGAGTGGLVSGGAGATSAGSNALGGLSGSQSGGSGGVSVGGTSAGDGAAGDNTAGMPEAGTDSGPPGHGLGFNGQQLLAFGPLPADDLTIEMWVKTTMTGPTGIWYQGAALFAADMPGDHNDFGASLVGDNFAFGTGSPDVTALSLSKVNTGVWTHLAASRERASSIVRIVVDGQAESSIVTGNREALDETDGPALGGHMLGGQFHNGFKGTVDEVRLWNVVRSPQQIADNLHTRLNGDEPGLVGYWRLDDGQGLVASDSSPSHHDATLGGGAPARVPEWVTYDAPALP